MDKAAQREERLDASSRRSSATSSSGISIAQLDDREYMSDCGSDCWLRRLKAESGIDQPEAPSELLLAEQRREARFQYSPLAKGQFRLLELQSAEDHTEVVRCTMTTSQLQTEHDQDDGCGRVTYDALSYTWGEKVNLQSILLNSKSFHVTPNLHSALRQLRHTKRHQKLWIDAICINQQDADEKSQQVRYMKTIYESAASVMVWLGQDFERSSLAIHAMHKLDNEDTRNVTFQQAHSESCMLELQAIFFAQLALYQRSYFRRTWIRQEIASAKRIIVCCGSKTVSWNLLRRSEKRLKRIGRKLDMAAVKLAPDHSAASYSTVDRKAFEWLKRHWSPGQSILQDFGDIRSLWYYHSGGLLELLMVNRAYDATDPRDKVYAVLGMAEVTLRAGKISDLKDHTDDSMIVDYSASVPAVYQYLAKYMINRDRNLDILCTLSTHRSLASLSEGLPTWTPDWRVQTHEIEIKACFDYFAEKYGTAGFTGALPQPYNILGILFVAGYYIDDIGSLVDATTSARNMFTDRGSKARIYSHQFRKDRDLRRCGRTRRTSLPCLIPRDSMIGDDIWVLLGGKLPFVVRQVDVNPSDTTQDQIPAFDHHRLIVGDIEKRYSVVGPCCIPGYMHGEAIAAAQRHGQAPQLLALV